MLVANRASTEVIDVFMYVKAFAISIIYVKIFTFSLRAKNSIITVVTYAN
jgi:hypothetical protein